MSEEQVLEWVSTAVKLLGTAKLVIPQNWGWLVVVIDKLLNILSHEATVKLIVAIAHFFDKQEDAKKLVALLGA